MRKDSIKTKISTLLNGKREHFIRFYINKDQFYKQIRCDTLQPGKLLLNDTLILFFDLDKKDNVCEADQSTCDTIIKFLLDPDR
jgi:hypothetical protein